MTDENINRWLNENAQGHKWELKEVDQTWHKRWERDDRAVAELEPYKQKNGEQWLALRFMRPVPVAPLPPGYPGTAGYVPPPPRNTLKEALIIGIIAAVVFGGLPWLLMVIGIKIQLRREKKQADKS